RILIVKNGEFVSRLNLVFYLADYTLVFDVAYSRFTSRLLDFVHASISLYTCSKRTKHYSTQMDTVLRDSGTKYQRNEAFNWLKYLHVSSPLYVKQFWTINSKSLINSLRDL
ncbi:hypothetical protein BpHYR1_021431, partial [Brachionus plicatilis]